MTSEPDEAGCGRCFDEGEFELLRTPDVPLPADLVRRVAQKDPSHWDDQPAIIRRVLPQLVVVLAEGEASPISWPVDWPRQAGRGGPASRLGQ
ncbi:hypothetical protein ACFCZT_41425 [Streptomyces sp. NPDC056230]|uniref:hypothetical protein n=1 Tax=Streptomyces sp. NPDC056230 TaxID=3345754 RepID=UPI0035E2964E